PASRHHQGRAFAGGTGGVTAIFVIPEFRGSEISGTCPGPDGSAHNAALGRGARAGRVAGTTTHAHAASRSESAQATTIVARFRSSSRRFSSARLALASRIERGPAP